VPAAVAARFPEPAVTFATPAFEPDGRHSPATTSSARSCAAWRGAAIGETRSEVSVIPLGVSQRGAPIEALAFTRRRRPAPSPAPRSRRRARASADRRHPRRPARRRARRHEALIVVAQELAAAAIAGVLDRVDVVLLPRANPDGAAAFQRGAADGTGRQRDHWLLQTPEARAVAELLASFAPLVVLDLHEYPVGGAFTTKFGGVQRFDALFQYATTANLAPFVTKAAEEWFRQPLLASLRSAGLSVDWYATSRPIRPDRTLTMGSVAPQVGATRAACATRSACSSRRAAAASAASTSSAACSRRSSP
jgi:hypothetical protein